MQKYYFGTGFVASASSKVSRDILEAELIDQYHWLPHEIAKIPYRKLQKLQLIKRYKNQVLNTKAATANAQKALKGGKMYRNV